MSRWQTVLDRILQGQADNNIAFAELRGVLVRLGFAERIVGDHYIFSKDAIAEIINIQPKKDGEAKAYQVKQARGILYKYGLTQV
jgi:hypothetical protein